MVRLVAAGRVVPVLRQTPGRMHGGHDRTSVLGLWRRWPLASRSQGWQRVWGELVLHKGYHGTPRAESYRLFGWVVGKLLPVHAIFFSQIDIWQSDVSKLFVARRRDVNLMSCSRLIS